MAISIDNVDMWNAAAPQYMKFIRNQKDVFSLYLNSPQTFRMVGDVLWKRVLDLGCGEGAYSRAMNKRGAKVVGLEPSELIDYAMATEEKTNQGVQFVRGRAEALDTMNLGTFDTVVATMVMSEIKDLTRAIKNVAKSLEKNGQFVFSILHPMTNCSGTEWVMNGLPKSNDPKADYFQSRDIKVTWKVAGAEEPFETLHYHRPVSEYILALTENNFVISQIVEPCPSIEQIKKVPAFGAQRQMPNFLHVMATYKG